MLNRVTITGADDATSISRMVELSAEFDFVEWAILVSRRQEGGVRFPSRQWMNRLFRMAPSTVGLSMHVCGAWVRELLSGQINWEELPDLQFAVDRMQLNTHAEPHDWDAEAVAGSWIAEEGLQIIVQYDDVNNALLGDLRACGVDAVPLFDLSHGAGALPDVWPAALPGVYCGYAGGLGPENIGVELPRVDSAAAGGLYWIDMESRVRTADGAGLDMDKVRAVLSEVRRLCPQLAREIA